MSSVIRAPRGDPSGRQAAQSPADFAHWPPSGPDEADYAPEPRMMAFDVRESRGLVNMTFSGLLGPVRRRSRRTYQAARPEPGRHRPDCPSWQLRTG